MADKPAYTIAAKLPIIATPDVKVTLMTYAPGQEVPWHSHSTVTDTTFCLEGQVELSFRDTAGSHTPDSHSPGSHSEGSRTDILGPGDHRQVEPGQVHRVRCVGPGQCRVLLVQGVGAYDFLPV